uniref:gamma-glutamylcyclotransferase n=1 Tax=Romanomermis culicivorax TaxID=13658 RepID=A0A915JQ90_ROMCU
MPADAQKSDGVAPLSMVESNKDDDIDDRSSFFYYFAYGSNLWSQRIRLSNPTAEFVAVGFLPGFSYGFAGPVTQGWCGCSATIWPAPDYCTPIDGLQTVTPIVSPLMKKYKENGVYGVIWRLGKENSATLDAQESGYVKIDVDVNLVVDGRSQKSVSCRTYVMSAATIASKSGVVVSTAEATKDFFGKPSPIYHRVIISGALEFQLPDNYVKFLNSFQNNGYSGPVKIATDETKFFD